MDEDLKEYIENVYRFSKCMQKWNFTIDRYTQSVKLSFVNFRILFNIFFTPNITQKMLCENLTLPKQTVNAAITYFYNKGYVKLIENPENRREKFIHFTDKGKEYSDNIILKFVECQFNTIKQDRYEEFKNLIKNLEYFAELSCSAIENLIKK